MSNPTLLQMPLAVNGDKNTIPVETGSNTGLFSQKYGFQSINSLPLSAGGKAISRHDYNGAMYLLSNILFYAQKGYTFEFDSTQDYFTGCEVIDPTDGNKYRCIVDVAAEGDSPSEDTTHWERIFNESAFFYRMPDVTYTVGDVKYAANLPSWGFLTCITGGVAGSGELVIPAGAKAGDTITDGQVVWRLDSIANMKQALAESTGYGIVSGCEPSISGLTVTVAAGVVHLADGTRKEIAETNITLDNADPTNPRIDLVYITSAGDVAKITGTASASPVVPTLPTGGISVCNVSVAAGANTGTITDKRDILPRFYNTGIVNIKDFGAVGDGVTDDTQAIKKALNTGNKVYFPKGRYRITETLSLYAGAVICGDSRRKTFLIADGCDFASGGGRDISHIEISNLTVTGDDGYVGLNLSGTSSVFGGRYSSFRNMDIRGFSTCIKMAWCWCITFYSCRIDAHSKCIEQGDTCNNITYIGCQFLGLGTKVATGIIINGHSAENKTIIFNGCDFENLYRGFEISNGFDIVITNFYAEAISTQLVYNNAVDMLKISNGYMLRVGRISTSEDTSGTGGIRTTIIDNILIEDNWDDVKTLANVSNASTVSVQIKNIKIKNTGSGTAWLCSIDSNSNGVRKEVRKKTLTTNSFSLNAWGSKPFTDTLSQNSFESIKVLSAYIEVLEAFTTSTASSVAVKNGDTELLRVNIPVGSYTAGQKINSGRVSSTITDYITDDLSTIDVRLNASTSVSTSCKLGVTFGVGEMKPF
jgi:hypothetical protein